jgi:pilus assembly protein CpaF
MDDTVQEILVDGPSKVYAERSRKLEDLAVSFDSDEAVYALINAVAEAVGAELVEGATTADIRLPDNSRFRVALPPTAVDGPYVVINKPFLGVQLTWEKLIEYGSVNRDVVEIIDSALEADASILISGGTFSGKTTLLNMVAGKLPEDRRIVVVEDIHHLQILRERVIYLEANAANESMGNLIEAASRMLPHCLVVNELNGPEVFTLLQKLNSGYFGMGSMHAETVQDALTRLETMCLMANQGLSLADIRRLVAGGIKLALQLSYLPDGKRKVVEMVEVQGVVDDRYLLQPLMRYNMESRLFEKVVVKPGWMNY